MLKTLRKDVARGCLINDAAPGKSCANGHLTETRVRTAHRMLWHSFAPAPHHADLRLHVSDGGGPLAPTRLNTSTNSQQATQRAWKKEDASFTLALYVSIYTHTKTIGTGDPPPRHTRPRQEAPGPRLGVPRQRTRVSSMGLVHGNASGDQGLLLLDLLSRVLDIRQSACESGAVGSLQELVARHHGRWLAS
jgi:hypothetical protein